MKWMLTILTPLIGLLFVTGCDRDEGSATIKQAIARQAPLIQAVQAGEGERVAVLLAQGVDPNTSDGSTPALIYAAMRPDLGIAEQLRKTGSRRAQGWM